MSEHLHDLIMSSAARDGQRCALEDGTRRWSYEALAMAVQSAASGFMALGLPRWGRVAVLLPKSMETVTAFFAASLADGIFVPVNPLLKVAQVGHILRDSGAEILLTSNDRLEDLAHELTSCPGVRTAITVGDPVELQVKLPCPSFSWAALGHAQRSGHAGHSIDRDPVSIFYTSGSTGMPKGVVLSHQNMLAGARSVASYLENTRDDRILAVLPFSFDYGFSQLTTAFHSGATVALLNYLLPVDVINALQRFDITGLAGVPPLWLQLAGLMWPSQVIERLRYITNSGGKMPEAVVRKLRGSLPRTRIYLMYGLTEAFRSTYLPPEEIDRRPTSIGKAIPNAEILVVRPDGVESLPNEPGELVHRGALVAQGYWRDPERTAQRFRPAPERLNGLPMPEMAVWSGDIVTKDEEGYLYFVGRNDEMIKTSGYRVSPTEVEEALYSTQSVSAAVVFGIEDDTLGQRIVAVVEPVAPDSADTTRLIAACRNELPGFMVPSVVIWQSDLPRNPNGKLDRSGIISTFRNQLSDDTAAK